MTRRHLCAERPVVLDTRVVKGSGGGPDKTILNTPRFLDHLGYRMLCAYMHPPGDPGFAQLREKAERWGAPLVSVPDRGFWDVSVVWKLFHLCRRERVAIWHGHDYKSNLIGLLLRPFWPMHLVTTVHGWVEWTQRTSLYFKLDRWCLPRYERVLCVSDDLHAHCLDAGVASQNCELLENGIDLEEFTRRRTRAAARRELGWRTDGWLIGAVGRLSPEKGFEVLIESVALLRERGIDVELVIVGEGKQKAELEALIGRLSLTECVRLLGYHPDVRLIYEALDIFALSSLREGLPNVLLEALALETPVVATRVAGVPRLIADGDTGLLVEPGHAPALADALARLLADVPLRERCRNAGRRLVEEKFNFAARVERLAAIYDSLLGRRTVRAA
jgi:glycosyltransferase involved in cell wall biosynthesis